MDSKREYNLAFTSILLLSGCIIWLSAGLICFTGCDKTPQARYDAMTGEKLPEKFKPFPIYKCADSSSYEVCWTRIDGHLYFILGSSMKWNAGSIIHAESCPCKTNVKYNVHN